MNIESITISGVTVEVDGEREVIINQSLVLDCDHVHSLLAALGYLGFDMRGYTAPEITAEGEA